MQITDSSFSFRRKTEQISSEATLVGIYVLRTGVPEGELPTGDVVRSYKGLEQAERAFKNVQGAPSC